MQNVRRGDTTSGQGEHGRLVRGSRPGRVLVHGQDGHAHREPHGLQAFRHRRPSVHRSDALAVRGDHRSLLSHRRQQQHEQHEHQVAQTGRRAQLVPYASSGRHGVQLALALTLRQRRRDQVQRVVGRRAQLHAVLRQVRAQIADKTDQTCHELAFC